MSNISKLMLSAEEQLLVCNTDWILTKRIILDKVSLILGELSEAQKLILEKEKGWLPGELILSSAKISKGENYLQLPYLILDHPRSFKTADIFAIRTMFWWGNFFSVTLQLSGSYKEIYLEKIYNNLPFTKENLFICVHEDQWQHHFEAGNYKNIKELTGEELREIIDKRSFLKLAVKFPLQHWDTMPGLLQQGFREIIELLKDQLPRR